MKHTKGPLKVIIEGGYRTIVGADGVPILKVEWDGVACESDPWGATEYVEIKEDDAERIVSAVNACDRANLTNAQLDAGVIETREGLLERCREVLKIATEQLPRFDLVHTPATHKGVNCTLAFAIDQLLADIGRGKEGAADG